MDRGDGGPLTMDELFMEASHQLTPEQVMTIQDINHRLTREQISDTDQIALAETITKIQNLRDEYERSLTIARDPLSSIPGTAGPSPLSSSLDVALAWP